MPMIPKPMPEANRKWVEDCEKKRRHDDLRYKFAMAALTGLLASPLRDSSDANEIAKDALLMADAMMARIEA